MPLPTSPVSVADRRVSDRLEQLSNSIGRKIPISHQIAHTIRDLIISGTLNPGDRIIESKIAKQLSVGQPTVREALVALEHQGLVVRKSNQGCVVTTLTRNEVCQILEVRPELEGLAVELGAKKGRQQDLEQLASAARRMKAAAQAKNIEEFYSHDLAFHNLLWKLPGNTVLTKLLEELMLPLLALCYLRNLRNRAYVDMTASAEAHSRIAAGLVSRKAAKARQIALDSFEIFAEQHLRYFEG